MFHIAHYDDFVETIDMTKKCDSLKETRVEILLAGLENQLLDIHTYKEAVYLKTDIYKFLLKKTEKLSPKDAIELLKQSIQLNDKKVPTSNLSRVLHAHNGSYIKQICSFFLSKKYIDRNSESDNREDKYITKAEHSRRNDQRKRIA